MQETISWRKGGRAGQKATLSVPVSSQKPEVRRERGHDMRQRAEERFSASSWLNAFSEKRNWCAIPTEWSWLDAENYQRSTHLDHASWSWLMLYISLSWPGWKQRSSKKCGSTDPFLCKRTFICEGSSATWFFHFFFKIFTPTSGHDYFSNGLKPPTSQGFSERFQLEHWTLRRDAQTEEPEVHRCLEEVRVRPEIWQRRTANGGNLYGRIRGDLEVVSSQCW